MMTMRTMPRLKNKVGFGQRNAEVAARKEAAKEIEGEMWGERECVEKGLKCREGNELDEESRILHCRQQSIYLGKAVACVVLILLPRGLRSRTAKPLE